MRPRSAVEHPKNNCKFCRNVRYFLIFAAFLLVMLWTQPEWRLPAGIDYSTLVGDLFLLAFLVTFGWKLWDHLKSRSK